MFGGLFRVVGHFQIVVSQQLEFPITLWRCVSSFEMLPHACWPEKMHPMTSNKIALKEGRANKLFFLLRHKIHSCVRSAPVCKLMKRHGKVQIADRWRGIVFPNERDQGQSRKKRPRMRMYADEEEEKAKSANHHPKRRPDSAHKEQVTKPTTFLFDVFILKSPTRLEGLWALPFVSQSKEQILETLWILGGNLFYCPGALFLWTDSQWTSPMRFWPAGVGRFRLETGAPAHGSVAAGALAFGTQRGCVIGADERLLLFHNRRRRPGTQGRSTSTTRIQVGRIPLPVPDSFNHWRCSHRSK